MDQAAQLAREQAVQLLQVLAIILIGAAVLWHVLIHK